MSPDQVPARWRIQRLNVGHAEHPVVIVDDFLPDPMGMREIAVAAPFGERDAAFPGSFAATPIPADAMAAALALVSPWPMDQLHCRRVAFGRYIDNRNSLKLRVPHTDDLAAVAIVYLNTRCNGGTGFYRHRATGIDYLAPEPMGRTKAVMDELGLRTKLELERHLQGMMMMDELHAVIVGDSAGDHRPPSAEDQWEMIERIPMRFNRLVMYDPHVFHNVYFDEGEAVPFGASPEEARTILRASFTKRDS